MSFFTLVLGQFVQFTSLQLIASLACWGIGAIALPDHWPYPSSALALLQAFALVGLGAYCYFLASYILSCLAFWLDVVWSLLAMFRFISMFVAGVLVPVALMPDAVQSAFRYTFPYWTVFAPAELLIGRMASDQVATGACVLVAWVVVLQLTAAWVWRRGVARFAGAGA